MKRSFVELDVAVDVEALRTEVDRLPADAWVSSLWGSPHCSISSVLLRGGSSGDASDFEVSHAIDHPVLSLLPSIHRLLDRTGPLGGCTTAFLFRMAPHGVALAHIDGAPTWHRHHRIHVPVRTHPDAKLVVAGRTQHLGAGRAWTFDNQALHGFVNGPVERVHLIADVLPNPTLDALLARGRLHPGELEPAVAAHTLERERRVSSYPGDLAIHAAVHRGVDAGWTLAEIAENLEQHGVPSRTPGGAWTEEAVGRFLTTPDGGSPLAPG